MKIQTVMRSALLAGCASLALTVSAAAQGWNGGFVGVNGGGGMLSGTSTNYYGDIQTSDWGVLGGGTAGFNWTYGSNVALGLVGDFDWSGMSVDSGDTDGGYYRQKTDWNWLATIRGRAGVVVDQALFYATAGVAFAGIDYKYCYYSDCSADTDNAKTSPTQTGMAVGAGVEFYVDDDVTADFSYLYVGMPTIKSHRINGDPINYSSNASIARVGINWHL